MRELGVKHAEPLLKIINILQSVVHPAHYAVDLLHVGQDGVDVIRVQIVKAGLEVVLQAAEVT